DKHIAGRDAVDPRGIAERQQDVPARPAVEPRLRLHKGRYRYGRVVHQPLPDTRQIGAHLDAEIHQRPGRPDAGAQQVRRRMDRAGADDDFAPGLIDAELGLRPFDERLDADAAGALEEQLGNLRRGRDRQVRTPPRAAVELADRGRDAPAGRSSGWLGDTISVWTFNSVQ